MAKPSSDDKIYISAYVGMGAEGRHIADTLRAKARAANRSLSEYLITSALVATKADTLHRKADTQPKKTPQELPPSLRPAKAAPRLARPDKDGIDMIDTPTIDAPAPSSKPTLDPLETF